MSSDSVCSAGASWRAAMRRTAALSTLCFMLAALAPEARTQIVFTPNPRLAADGLLPTGIAEPQRSAAAGSVMSGQRISSILVIGNRALTQTAITIASGHAGGDPCTAQTLDEMRVNLIRTGNFGLHSVSLEDSVKIHAEPDPSSPGDCKVVIEVDENDVIAGVDIQGSGPVKSAKIAELLHLKRGVIYNPIQFRRDYEDIQQLYNRQGYAVVPAENAGFDTKNILNISLSVVRVAEIHVLNNHKTRSIVVVREMRTRRNGYYNTKTLQQDRVRLLNLGLFEDVVIDRRNLGSGQVAIDVHIKEKQVGAVQGGFSFSQRDGLLGDVKIADDNFRGMGESVSLYGELGTDLQRHSEIASYRRPWLDDQGTGLELQLYDRNVNRFADDLVNAAGSVAAGQGGRYSQQQTGASVGLSRPLSSILRGSLFLRGENTQTDPLGLTGINSEIIQDGPVYSVGAALSRDTRDLIADPVRGGYQNLTLSFGHADLHSPLEAAGETTLYGSHNFTRSQLDWRYYLSLSGMRRPDHPDEEKTSLAMRLMAGSSAGRLPFSEQFFLGGADTLRGYREDRFWGKNLFLSSLELRQPLAHRFQAVAFMDLGEAWGGDYSNLDIAGFEQRGFQPHLGAGFGFRARTPIGSVRLDFGFGDEGARTHLGFGSTF